MAPENSAEAFFTHKRDRESLAALDWSRVPAHVAVIMDGNGRWAARRGLPRAAGHRAGAKAVRESIASAIELGVRYLTIYSFSSENWTRPAEEVSGLMSLFIEVLKVELDNLQRMDVRVRVIGEVDAMPPSTAGAFRDAVEATKGNGTLDLVVALNYGGRDEIVRAARSLAAEAATGGIDPKTIDEDAIASRLYTTGLPDPDLVVRTSGEMRVSNFLLWQIAYSELYVTSVLWPDFKRGDFLRAVVDYQRRERRFGGR
jgi:undecaprenyl diphosphate synthase